MQKARSTENLTVSKVGKLKQPEAVALKQPNQGLSCVHSISDREGVPLLAAFSPVPVDQIYSARYLPSFGIHTSLFFGAWSIHVRKRRFPTYALKSS